jgi:hypothetical protein
MGLRHLRRGEARLVAQHALGRAVQGFVEAHEAAGQRPAAGMGMLGPLHQEHGRTARAQPHQDEIDGERRPREGGGVVGAEKVVLGHGAALYPTYI